MSTIVSLVNSTPTYGLNDGYRRAQLGNPSGTVGQPPKFRGEVNKPGSDIKAPRILSSAARNNRATNVTIPYTRVCAADELCNKGRLSKGDVAFISRYQYGISGQLKMNQHQKNQIVTSASMAHAHVCRLVGLDWINRMLGADNYVPGNTVLVDSANPLDDWRSLTFLNTYTLDGVVMSNDTPGYVTNTSSGASNDQIFNMGIQGPVQLNNGYEDDAGRGVAAYHDRHSQMAAGSFSLKQPHGMARRDYVEQGAGASSMVQALIAGPAYTQYPIQMFDRKIRPLSDLYIGLICRKIPIAEVKGLKSSYAESFKDAKSHIHVFQYVCFSSRQVYQFATEDGDPDGLPDRQIVDTGLAGRRGTRDGPDDYNLGEAEPADRRRGPNDPKRGRNDNFLPRKRAGDSYQENDNFLGIKKIELKHMVGAWRIGKVLDIASQRKEQFTSGPIDTSFSVTLNLDISFLDWRQLRRNFTMNIFGYDLDINDGLGGTLHWENYDAVKEKFDNDLGRVMQWPTVYNLYDKGAEPEAKDDDNIPYNNSTNPRTLELLADKGTQRSEYQKAVDVSKGDDIADPFAGPAPIGQPAPEQSRLPSEQPLLQPVAAAATPSAFDASVESSGPLSFPEQTQRQQVAAPVAAPKPTSKAASKAPVAAAVSESTISSAKQPAKPTSRSAPKKPATAGAIGDDVMATIFGSAVPSGVDVGASGADAVSADRQESDGRPSEQPKSFPRRRER